MEMNFYNVVQKTNYVEGNYEGLIKKNEVAYLFVLTSRLENELDKDILDFSKNEISQLIKELNVKNEAKIESYIKIIRDYIMWGMSNGYADDKVGDNNVFWLMRLSEKYKKENCNAIYPFSTVWTLKDVLKELPENMEIGVSGRDHGYLYVNKKLNKAFFCDNQSY